MENDSVCDDIGWELSELEVYIGSFGTADLNLNDKKKYNAFLNRNSLCLSHFIDIEIVR